MKNAMLLGLLATAMSWAGERDVIICITEHTTLDHLLLHMAEGYATRIYQAIAVNLHWKSTCSEVEREAPGTRLAPNLMTIGIEFAESAPASVLPGALASARPYQPTGTRVTLYLDRLAPALYQGRSAAALLGHVLAHEIGHVLLGHNGHTPEGVMQSRWSISQQCGMRQRLMRLSDMDANLIHHNLNRRATVLAASR